MELITNSKELKAYLNLHKADKNIGFIPTMGALHEGHLSLIKEAEKKDDIIICSIFVNPTQFNEKVDFDNYPKVLDADQDLLAQTKVDVVFAPGVDDIYPDGMNIPHYDIGFLDNVLEGEHRPGHFQGVCHIIHVFLDLIQPTHIYMGEKDIQQVAVVNKLIEIKNHSTVVIPCSTKREKSGLAMSSRNRLLSEEGKIKAATFNRALQHIRTKSKDKDYATLKAEADAMLIEAGLTPEYIALCETSSLVEMQNFDHSKTMRLIGAAWLEGVRLIDNIGI